MISFLPSMSPQPTEDREQRGCHARSSTSRDVMEAPAVRLRRACPTPAGRGAMSPRHRPVTSASATGHGGAAALDAGARPGVLALGALRWRQPRLHITATVALQPRGPAANARAAEASHRLRARGRPLLLHPGLPPVLRVTA